LEALARLEALSPRLVLPGHGEPLEDPLARTAALHAAAEGETDAVAALLEAGPATAWEAVERRYAGRDLPASTRMLALRETRAHLDRLERAGRATRHAAPGGADRFSRPR
ncbi:MAG TPA: hypothetical protein VHG91_01605, partial [Longimicrobium sp.]|nr:hypothetical protein [Longimicrobium sp.]